MTTVPATHRFAADRWAVALAGWAVPDEILRQAPESPWGFPPSLFDVSARPTQTGDPSRRRALEALPRAGTVLDVGCGGGAAAMALTPAASRLTGVDQSPAMLKRFAQAADARGVAHLEIEGVWPEVAGAAPAADVVVCHHVAYNVAGIAPFIAALAAHAARRVVMEVTASHPGASLGPLWKWFWGLDRPSEPTADLLIEVVREAGFTPHWQRQERPVSKVAPHADHVAFVRRRLCLDESRDQEVAQALRAAGDEPAVRTVTLW